MSEKSDYQKHLESMSEIEYKRLTQGDWSRNETDTRVRCTKDGEYPKIGQTVIYVEYGEAHLGKLLFKDDDGHEWQNDTGTQWFLKQTAIYWQPVITSLKEQYEREKGGVI